MKGKKVSPQLGPGLFQNAGQNNLRLQGISVRLAFRTANVEAFQPNTGCPSDGLHLGQHRGSTHSLSRMPLLHPPGLERRIWAYNDEFEPPTDVFLGECCSEVVREHDDGLDLVLEYILTFGSHLQATDQQDIGKVANDI